MPDTIENILVKLKNGDISIEDAKKALVADKADAVGELTTRLRKAKKDVKYYQECATSSSSSSSGGCCY